MGAVFFLIPAVLVLSSIAWFGARLLKGAQHPSLGKRLRVAARPAREPLQVALVLGIVGVVLTGFVAGDLGAGTYLRIGRSTLGFLLESVTDWADPGTSESITLRGFAFIVMGSCGIVGYSMWRYYSGRWEAAEEAVAILCRELDASDLKRGI